MVTSGGPEDRKADRWLAGFARRASPTPGGTSCRGRRPPTTRPPSSSATSRTTWSTPRCSASSSRAQPGRLRCEFSRSPWSAAALDLRRPGVTRQPRRAASTSASTVASLTAGRPLLPALLPFGPEDPAQLLRADHVRVGTSDRTLEGARRAAGAASRPAIASSSSVRIVSGRVDPVVADASRGSTLEPADGVGAGHAGDPAGLVRHRAVRRVERQPGNRPSAVADGAHHGTAGGSRCRRSSRTPRAAPSPQDRRPRWCGTAGRCAAPARAARRGRGSARGQRRAGGPHGSRDRPRRWPPRCRDRRCRRRARHRVAGAARAVPDPSTRRPPDRAGRAARPRAPVSPATRPARGRRCRCGTAHRDRC